MTRAVPRGGRRPIRVRTVAAAAGAYTIAVLFLLPYLQMVNVAVRSPAELTAPTILPRTIDGSAFVTIWGTDFGGSLATSLLIAGGSTVLVLLVALPAAYYTARTRFRGRGPFLLLVLATQMFQPAAMLVGIQREFLAVDIPPVAALILVDAGFNLAFAVWISNAFIGSIPVELEEAAMVDGCSRLGAVARVTLPLAAPGIVTALIFTFIAAWNELLVALTLTLGSPSGQRPLTVAINDYIGQYSVDWSHLFAGSLIATVPVVILFAIIEKRVVGGLTAGAIK